MRNKFIKISLIFFACLILVFGATLIYINSQIDPEKIKKMIVKTIESNLKDSKASIVNLDYSLGQKITFKIDTLAIKHKNKDFVGIKKIKIHIPLVSILTSGGVVDINFSGSSLLIEQKNDGSLNVNDILLENKTKKKKAVKLEIPKFLEKSKINLKVTDTLLNFNQKGQSNFIEIKKVILKNINLQKTTAFEISSILDMKINQKNLKTSMTLIGEIPIRNIIDKKPAKIDLMIQVGKSSFGEYNLESSKHRGIFTFVNPQNISLKMRSDIDDLVSGDIEASLVNNQFTAKKIEYLIKTSGVIKTLNLENVLKENQLTLNGLDINVKGTLQLNIEELIPRPNLLISSNKVFNLTHPEIELSPNFDMNILNEDININFNSGVLEKGKITAQIKTKLVYEDLQSLKPIEINLEATGINSKISKISLVELANKKETEQVVSEQLPVLDLSFLDEIPEVKVSAKVIESKINEINYSLESTVNFLNRKVFIKNFLLNFPEAGRVNSNNIEVDLTKNNSISSTGEVITDLNLVYFSSVMPNEVEKIKGQLNSNTQFDVSLEKSIDYSAKGKFSIKDSSIKDFNVYVFLKPFIKKYKFLQKEAKKNQEVTSGFNLISSGYKLSTNEIALENLIFIGENNEFSGKGKGNIYLLENRTSKLYIDLIVKSWVKDALKVTGKKDIPLLLKGKGFVLLPDENYTTKIIGKRLGKNAKKQAKIAAKKAIKKEKKKINKRINEEKKKAEERLKKEAKKLLKGIKL